ncbi:hypothetical protein BGZ79_006180, partial [Entomortierella chlamydospora]
DRASRGTETEDEEDESSPSDNVGPGDDDIGDGAAGEASTVEGAESIEKRKALLEARLRGGVRDAIRDSLIYDPYISETAEAFGIPEDERITVDKDNRLTFYLKANYFEDWKERHQVNIGTSFSPHGNPHTYSVKVHKDSAQSKKERAGQTVTYYDCHCRGKKSEQKLSPGGKSGKTRMRTPSIRCGCSSRFSAIYQPTPT